MDPPRRLRHTYRFTMTPEHVNEVTWQLDDLAERCRVTVTHAGCTDEKDAKKHGAGWVEILTFLKSELETGSIPAKTRLICAVQSWFLWALPRRTRVEEVDRAGW